MDSFKAVFGSIMGLVAGVIGCCALVFAIGSLAYLVTWGLAPLIGKLSRKKDGANDAK